MPFATRHDPREGSAGTTDKLRVRIEWNVGSPLVAHESRRTNGAMVTTSHPATRLVATAQPPRGQPREQALDVNARAARATASDRRVRGSCRSTSSSSTIRTMRCFIVL
jgi:hypothetical protein